MALNNSGAVIPVPTFSKPHALSLEHGTFFALFFPVMFLISGAAVLKLFQNTIFVR